MDAGKHANKEKNIVSKVIGVFLMLFLGIEICTHPIRPPSHMYLIGVVFILQGLVKFINLDFVKKWLEKE